MHQTVTIGNHYTSGMCAANPIHTSSHYQTFETPHLKELVGGDRNMEQTNLVVTSDGKTWDEVTRDTSYIGNLQLSLTHDNGYDNFNEGIAFDDCRGMINGYKPMMNKDFAIAYLYQICLVDGQYEITVQSRCRTSQGASMPLYINGTEIARTEQYAVNEDMGYSRVINLKRGDKIQVMGRMGNSHIMNLYQIRRIN